MERTDKNLWYRVKRYPPQPNLYYPAITDQYKKTGIFSHEASTQPYAKIVSGGGDDKNVTFQLPRSNLQPILPQRVFKDLDPQTRVIGSLDLTKSDRQKTAVVESLQGLSDQISNFIATPKKDAAGNILIDPVTNKPIMESRRLDQILTVSQDALFKAMKDQNVVPTNHVTNIINSFTSTQIMNVLAKFRGIATEFPVMPLTDKTKAFSAAILNERMLDLSSAPQGIEDDIGAELNDEKMTDFEDDWDIPYTNTIFVSQGFSAAMWMASQQRKDHLKEYLMARLNRNPADHITTVAGRNIAVRDVARQFARDRLHVLNLRTLNFIRPGTPAAGILLRALHS